jgi:hypothetical protein
MLTLGRQNVRLEKILKYILTKYFTGRNWGDRSQTGIRDGSLGTIELRVL